MSAVPIPKPRAFASQENKKPVPLPRHSIKKNYPGPIHELPSPESQNTFSRRMRNLGNTSRQITDEITEKVQETKKAVIESTRQSVRKITRRFSSSLEQQECSTDNVTENSKDVDDCSSEIFNTIRFQSPLTIDQDVVETITETAYDTPVRRDINGNDSGSDDSISFPPPNHPPPPLPDESTYDRPLSVAMSLPTKPPMPARPAPAPIPRQQQQNYESIFPLPLQVPLIPTPVPFEIPLPTTPRMEDPKSPMERSTSFTFYDPVTLDEGIYANTESAAHVIMTQNNGKRSSDSGSLSSAYSELNSCYENFILELRKQNEAKEDKPPALPCRPSKSTIFEFDPLMNQPNNNANNNDMAFLVQMLQSGLNGNGIDSEINYDQLSLSSEQDTDEYMIPPTPPKRFDSLGEDFLKSSSSEDKSKTNWFTTPPNVNVVPEKPQPENKKVGWMKQLNDVLKKVPESARNIRAGLQKDKALERPMLSNITMASHKGMLFRVSRKSVEDLFGEFSFRWGVLANSAMTMYADNACDNIKEQFNLESILSVQVMEKKLKFETEMHCFEVSVSSRGGRAGHTFGCRTLSDCKLWMQKIAVGLTNRFPLNVMSDYRRIGWAYLKESVSGSWAGAWLIVSARSLYYAKNDAPMCTVDLRKARCIQLQDLDSESPKTTDKGPNLLVDSQEGTLYLRMWTAKETKIWCYVIQNEAFKNGRKIDEQQLTKDNVPVLVEKCINFIYAHGSMSEGIYRRSGSTSKIAELMNQFHHNAWSVALTLDTCSEHDAANVLKRFLRALPEPLLTAESSKYMCQIADAFQNASEKATLYKAILEQFPPVIYNTLHKLLGHLHFIQTQVAKNRMSVDNLAAIWGPTLVQHESPDGEWSPTESNLMVQLIAMYRDLFPASADELNKEKMMLQVLERCYRGSTTGQGPAHVKASGDLRVWVHLWDKSGETVNITIGPQKLAADICMELSEKMKLPANELQLEELVLNYSLRRPVHYSEKVLDVVLRWGYWNEADRKDNCLVLTSMEKYKPFDDTEESSAVLSEEFRFADNKTKTFKSFTFKFSQMKLSYYKDKSANIKIQEWNIEDILWYFGFEPRRDPQTKWHLTFILRTQPPKRSKGLPYFGYTFGGNDVRTRVNWVRSMIRAEHSSGLQPPLRKRTN